MDYKADSVYGGQGDRRSMQLSLRAASTDKEAAALAVLWLPVLMLWILPFLLLKVFSLLNSLLATVPL